jgi:hypothetical protein
MRYYATFGTDHLDRHGRCLYNKKLYVEADDASHARIKIFAIRGDKFAFLYAESNPDFDVPLGSIVTAEDARIVAKKDDRKSLDALFERDEEELDDAETRARTLNAARKKAGFPELDGLGLPIIPIEITGFLPLSEESREQFNIIRSILMELTRSVPIKADKNVCGSILQRVKTEHGDASVNKVLIKYTAED